MSSIAQQAAEVSAASTAHLPAEIAQVFTDEQQRWRERGEPAGAIAAGEKLADFTLPDANGSPVSLTELLADGPVVVVFYRGGWCPYCNLALRAYQAQLLPELDRYNAQLVAISPQSPEKSLRTTEKAELSYPVLSDAGAETARRLGIAFEPTDDVLAAQRKLGLDLSKFNASGDTSLPMPTVLIVDQAHMVRFADTHADYTARTEVDDILNALAAITA